MTACLDLQQPYTPPPSPATLQPPDGPPIPPGFPGAPGSPQCGNGACEIGEPMSCPNDCVQVPVCGDDTCTWGESCQFCPQDCGICPAPVHCDDVPEGSTLPLSVDGTTRTAYAWDSPAAGVYDITATPGATVTIKAGNCVGSTLTNPVGLPPHSAIEITVDAADPTPFTLHVDRLPDLCGDGVCEQGEACDACVPDCGECSPDPGPSDPGPTSSCGNGICDAGESWSTCLSDCPD